MSTTKDIRVPLFPQFRGCARLILVSVAVGFISNPVVAIRMRLKLLKQLFRWKIFWEMSPLWIAALFTVSALGTCATANHQLLPGPHIVGGVDTDISEVPYQAALLMGSYHFCGAAIISENYLLTGAHCILFVYQMFDSEEGMLVRVGSNHSEKGGVLLRPLNTTCHPRFNFDTYDYDVCLIQVENPMDFTRNIRAIRIGEVEPQGGEVAKVAGWGTLWAGGSVPERLQSVVIPVTNRTYCKDAYEKISPVTERMFCAGETGKDSCQGDSGGGLAVDGVLMGVISTGFGCGAPGFPGVYTSVAHPEIRKFIREVSGV